MTDVYNTQPRSTAAQRGQRIYQEALAKRPGFHPNEIGIAVDDVVWEEIFEAIGRAAIPHRSSLPITVNPFHAAVRDDNFNSLFHAIFRELSAAYSRPDNWTSTLRRPEWWQLKRWKAYRVTSGVFSRHGFVLDDALADRFDATTGRQDDEDAASAFVRRLRQTFQPQMGVLYKDH